jgi:DNA-binding transcriptional ArsR family regulator
MASALPHRPSIRHTPAERSTVELGEASFRRVFDALASETARSILEEIAAEPATASELATRVDTSIQNVEYHLTQLREAGLIVEAGVWYSERGTEMSVYAPRLEELVVRFPAATGDAD